MTRRLLLFVVMAALATALVVAGVFFGLGLWLRSQQPSPPPAADVSRAESSLSRLPRLPESLATLRGVVDAAQRAVEAELDIRFALVPPESPRTICGPEVLDATRAEVGVDTVRRADVLLTESQWFAAVSAVQRALGPRAMVGPGSRTYLVEYRVPDVGTIAMTRTPADGGFVTIKGETECRLP